MKLFFALPIMCAVTSATLANTSPTTVTREQHDGWRACQDELRALGQAVFATRLTLKERTVTLHFPAPIGDVFIVVDSELSDQHRAALSLSGSVFGVSVNGTRFLVFPDEAPMLGGGCSQIHVP